MSLWIIITISILMLIFAQDLRGRRVHLAAFIAAAIAVYALRGEVFSFTDLSLNLALITIQALVLWIYFRFRGVSLLQSIGIGDILFFVIIAAALPFTHFLGFQVLSLSFALIFHLAFRGFKWYGARNLIPLAGLQAVCLAVYLVNIHFSLFNLSTYANILGATGY